MADRPKPSPPCHPDTVVTHAGLSPRAHFGVVNPPVFHASTILFENAEALRHPERAVTTYGRFGTPGTYALGQAMLELEEAEAGAICRLAPSGHAAVTEVLLSYCGAGGHMLMADGVYGPTRATADMLLKRFGVETTYYDPAVGAGIADFIRPNTQLIFLEVPASRTFEMMDVPAIARVAREKGVVTAIDNTWATPYFFKPLRHGVDVSNCAGTKFIAGHSDVLIGTVTANKAAAPALKRTHLHLGQCVGPDDVYLTQRGLRTLGVRMARHMESGLEVARWLAERDDVARVMHPALSGDPGHALWARDFTGACGVFAFEMRGGTEAQADALLDTVRLFGLGYSFGGFESLIIPSDVSAERTACPPSAQGPQFRLHIGLEDPRDLIADLGRALDAFHGT